MSVPLGRENRTHIWIHFKLDDKENNTQRVRVERNDFTGKSTTNLKRHLQACHREIHAKVSTPIVK
ncbi:hypothetical protein LDENG_00040440 [Lucifuga dentata]|nr:hypothetical protein LDENG_00040440 [Lucifuga dentata]